MSVSRGAKRAITVLVAQAANTTHAKATKPVSEHHAHHWVPASHVNRGLKHYLDYLKPYINTPKPSRDGRQIQFQVQSRTTNTQRKSAGRGALPQPPWLQPSVNKKLRSPAASFRDNNNNSSSSSNSKKSKNKNNKNNKNNNYNSNTNTTTTTTNNNNNNCNNNYYYHHTSHTNHNNYNYNYDHYNPPRPQAQAYWGLTQVPST